MKMKPDIQFADTKERTGGKKPLKAPGKLKKHRTSKGKLAEVNELVSRYAVYLSHEAQESLHQLTRFLTKPGKGILAADDSVRQIGEKLSSINMENSEQNRRRYHEMLLGAGKGLSLYLSGILLREEMVTQKFYRGKKLTQMLNDVGIQLGIRADKGVVPLPRTTTEWTTAGLDGLDEACTRYKDLGASFTLWRCVYRINPFTPSRQALEDNSHVMARFASISQTAGLVPIVSPEVLLDGDHTPEVARSVLGEILTSLMKALSDHQVYLEGLMIRLTAAVPGQAYKEEYEEMKAVDSTMKIINRSLPAAVGGILLSSPYGFHRALDILNQMNKFGIKKPIPMSFCFSHVIQEGVIGTWAGHERNVEKAHDLLIKRAKMCSLASVGQQPEASGSCFISNITKY